MDPHPFMGLVCSGLAQRGALQGTTVRGWFAGFNAGDAFLVADNGQMHHIHYSSLQFVVPHQAYVKLCEWSSPPKEIRSQK
jgi:hypothetical protein